MVAGFSGLTSPYKAITFCLVLLSVLIKIRPQLGCQDVLDQAAQRVRASRKKVILLQEITWISLQ